MRNIWFQSVVLGVVVFAVGVLASACAGVARPAGDLDQNWNADQITRWHEASQGSRLLPLAWMRALEQPGNTRAFLDDAHMEALGYLPSTTRHGQRLPVGFAVDRTDARRLGETNLKWKSRQRRNEPWVGFNCSACHTARIDYEGRSLRVEGGPGMADFQGFIEALDAALVATRADPGKFDRFAKAVLAREDTPANRTLLNDALGRLIRRQTELARLNATDLRYGPGRVDAFGHIFNKVAYAAGAEDQLPNPSDAPVSYPFLWNVPQHDRLQWNGQINNTVISGGRQPVDIGALGRNVGEVIGVFADIEVGERRLRGFRSSADVRNLIRLEQQLGSLRPPAWPSDLFPADPDHARLAAEGAELFRTRCESCHARLERTDLVTPIRADFSYFNPALSTPPGRPRRPPPGTDPWMACNAFLKEARTGRLRGVPRDYIGRESDLGTEDRLSDMLVVLVTGALVNQAPTIVVTTLASAMGLEPPPEITLPVDGSLTEREIRLQICMSSGSDKLGYKARPLTGIWATAPYLHNGSVRTLYELLLPDEARETSFPVGSREFDPRDVGFRPISGPGGFIFRTVDERGEPIPGNSNRGHDYDNASLTEDNRRALVEYLKTL